MINTNLVKALLAYYLKIKFIRWGISTDGKLELPTDQKKLDKIDLTRKLYFTLQNNYNNKTFLLDFCNKLEAIEENEKTNHHSKYAPGLFDYPVMACVIRALRSHIMNAASPHIAPDEPKSLALYNYLNGDFLNVLKYEDYHYAGGKHQSITSISDFVESYKQDATSFGLLDRVYLARYNDKHPDRKESHVAIAAIAMVNDSESTNKDRHRSMHTLFAEKTERKKQKAARPVLTAKEPEKKSNLEELNKIIAELDAANAKAREYPTLTAAMGMGKR